LKILSFLIPASKDNLHHGFLGGNRKAITGFSSNIPYFFANAVIRPPAWPCYLFRLNVENRTTQVHGKNICLVHQGRAFDAPDIYCVLCPGLYLWHAHIVADKRRDYRVFN
jgi:hypothetical protein